MLTGEWLGVSRGQIMLTRESLGVSGGQIMLTREWLGSAGAKWLGVSAGQIMLTREWLGVSGGQIILTRGLEVLSLADRHTEHRVTVDAGRAAIDMRLCADQDAGTLEDSIHVGRCGIHNEGRTACLKESFEWNLGQEIRRHVHTCAICVVSYYCPWFILHPFSCNRAQHIDSYKPMSR